MASIMIVTGKLTRSKDVALQEPVVLAPGNVLKVLKTAAHYRAVRFKAWESLVNNQRAAEEQKVPVVAQTGPALLKLYPYVWPLKASIWGMAWIATQSTV